MKGDGSREATDQGDRDVAQERDLFRAAFDGAFDAIVIVDDEGRYVEVNQSAAELFGLPKEEVMGRSIRDFAPDDFDFETAWQTFQKSGVERGMFPLVRADGDIRLTEYAATRNIVSGRHLSVLRDVTDRERWKEQLQEQNERLEEFAGIVSHDLRNPLNVAQGRLELASEEYESEHHEAAAAALARMERIIDGMLLLAREGRDINTLEPIGLEEAVATAWAMVTDDVGGLTIDFDDKGEWELIEADPNRLQQLLENLFRNAVEHGGEDVTVTVGKLDTGFYVEDTGPGIPAEKRDGIFEAGQRAPSGGARFGLRIVKNVVDAHGWDIRVSEGTDGGTRFEITGVVFVV